MRREAPGNGNGTHRTATPETPWSRSRYLLDFLSCCHTPISRLMSQEVVCVAPELSVEGLATLLVERGLSAVPVVDRGHLVGIVSTAEALGELEERESGEEHLRPRWVRRRGVPLELEDGYHATTLVRATVREIMSPFALALPPTASVAQAAALMAAEAIDQLPVVEAGFRVVGMLTARDVMRWLANQSGFLLPATDRGNGRAQVLVGREFGPMTAPPRGARSEPCEEVSSESSASRSEG